MGSRYQRARQMGITDKAIKLPRPAEENDAIAVAAEHFVLDPFGFKDQVDDDRGPRDHDWWVWHVVKGRNVLSCGDVKWTPREDGRLIVLPKDQHYCTVYCLVVGDPGRFRLAGWEWGYKVAQTPLDTSGRFKVPPHAIDQSDLRSPASFAITMAATFGETRRPG